MIIRSNVDLNLLGTKGYNSDLIRVTYKCDNCGKEVECSYRNLVRKGKLNTQLCNSCTIQNSNRTEKYKKTCLDRYGVDHISKINGLVKKVNKSKIQFSHIKEQIEKENYQFLSEEPDHYNSTTHFNVICDNGHKFKTNWSKWNAGYRCKICSRKRVSDLQKTDFNEIKEYINKENYTLVSTEYINCDTPLELICPEGHKYDVTWWNFKSSGNRCPICSGRKLDYNKIYESFNKENYKIINTNYSDSRLSVEYKCPKGHTSIMKWGNWEHNKERCPICSRMESNEEKEVFDFLSPYFDDIIQNDRILIKPKELDIVIPSKRIAIEYCGLYWHTESKVGRLYHLGKLNQCNEIGYKLITLFQDEWIYNKEVVKNRLKNILGISDTESIYARKCEIREIEPHVKNEFLNKFHLQGSDRSNVNIGLFYSNNLVSVMTFSKGNISKGSEYIEDVYELSRFCSDYNHRIIGGAGKLFKYFINNYNPKEIYSYSDKRWSDGNLYKQIGFEYVHDSKPSYYYMIENKRIHRFNFRKNVLKDKLKNFNEDLSEYENMLNNNYDRVWDCGNKKWNYKNM